MTNLVEMDPNVPLRVQLADAGEGPVVLVNTFKVEPEDVDQFLKAWTADAAVMKRQPGFVSTQLHRGIAGSTIFMNYAVWQSTAHFQDAFNNPDFRAKLSAYPVRTTASPHLFRKLGIPEICEA